jgi:hypothetical protein
MRSLTSETVLPTCFHKKKVTIQIFTSSTTSYRERGLQWCKKGLKRVRVLLNNLRLLQRPRQGSNLPIKHPTAVNETREQIIRARNPVSFNVPAGRIAC